jgi:hypothetical protein
MFFLEEACMHVPGLVLFLWFLVLVIIVTTTGSSHLADPGGSRYALGLYIFHGIC